MFRLYYQDKTHSPVELNGFTYVPGWYRDLIQIHIRNCPHVVYEKVNRLADKAIEENLFDLVRADHPHQITHKRIEKKAADNPERDNCK